MNWKGFARKRSWHLPGGTEENLRETSVMIAGVRAEIPTDDLSSTNLQSHRTVLMYLTPSSLVYSHRRFGRGRCFRLHGTGALQQVASKR
jgi:hypothetical protein